MDKSNSALSFVHRLGVRLSLWEVEFLFGSADVDPVPGKGAVIYRALLYREVALGLDGNIVRPEERISPAVHFVGRDGNGAVAVGVFEGEIYPDLGLIRELFHVEFARRDHDLPFDAIDHVAVDIDAGKSVVRPQALNLLELGFERSPIPDAGVLQRCATLVQVLAGERRGRDGEFPLFHRRPVEIVGFPRAGDASEQIRLLKGYLVRTDIEALDGRRNDGRSEVEGRKQPAGDNPMGRPHQQPDANPRYASRRHQDEGGSNPANHDDVVCRDPEIDVGKRAAGNDLRMSIDDEMIPAEKAGYARREAEQRSQHQALA